MSDTNLDLALNRRKYPFHYPLTAQHDILAWLDTISLSRPIHNLEVDFADGVLIAEIVAYYFPEYVDLEMFHASRHMSQRAKNWRLLNSDVLPKLSLNAPGAVVRDITNGDNRAIELFLIRLREKIEEHLMRTGRRSRLQWDARHSYNVDRHRFPQLFLTSQGSRRAGFLPGYGTIGRNGLFMNSYAPPFDDVLTFKDEEIQALREKLKHCERIVRAKDKKIQQLEEKIEQLRPRRPSP